MNPASRLSEANKQLSIAIDADDVVLEAVMTPTDGPARKIVLTLGDDPSISEFKDRGCSWRPIGTEPLRSAGINLRTTRTDRCNVVDHK